MHVKYKIQLLVCKLECVRLDYHSTKIVPYFVRPTR